MKTNRIPILIMAVLVWGCNNNENGSDAYGNFEAEEIMVAAEANGRILQLDLEEGQELDAGQVVGLVDTAQLYLKKEQLKASMVAIASREQDIQVQLNVLRERRNILEREENRIQRLLADEAATQKQLDDIQGEIEVVNRQISATRRQMQTANRGLLSEIRPLEIQVDQINDQINKSLVSNPRSGRVLTKYAEAGEVATFGRPLYKIANLNHMDLRAYISGDQLSAVKLGDIVTVKIDEEGGGLKNYEGEVTWIASEAEFTPKVVQTREERVNLVYAMTISVKNDGSIKIGMPGEVEF